MTSVLITLGWIVVVAVGVVLYVLLILAALETASYLYARFTKSPAYRASLRRRADRHMTRARTLDRRAAEAVRK